MAVSFGLAKRLHDLRERYGDSTLTLLTVLLLLLLFVIVPVQASGIVVIEPFGPIVALIMIVAALVVSASPLTFFVLMVAFCMNVVVIVSRL